LKRIEKVVGWVVLEGMKRKKRREESVFFQVKGYLFVCLLGGWVLESVFIFVNKKIFVVTVCLFVYVLLVECL
jgi:hypothetical protein